MRVRVAAQARADLDAIWLYIARESGNLDLATRTIASIADKFGLFARHPSIGKALALGARSGVRTFPVGNFRIFYRAESAEIRILRIIHSSRDIDALFSGG